MADEKKNDINTELKDEELNDAAGGAGRRDRSESKTISCKRCGNPIPANSTVEYCGDCLRVMRKTESHPFR